MPRNSPVSRSRSRCKVSAVDTGLGKQMACQVIHLYHCFHPPSRVLYFSGSIQLYGERVHPNTGAGTPRIAVADGNIETADATR